MRLAALAVAALFFQEASRVEVWVFSSDGLPAAGAEVHVGGASGTTDETGVVRLSVPAGVHPLSAALPGGGKAQGRVTVAEGKVTEALVRLGAAGKPGSVDVEAPAVEKFPEATPENPLKPRARGRIEGRILNEKDGRPVKGVRIYVRGQKSEAVTGEDGAFALEVPAGVHVLSLIHTEFRSRTLKDVRVEENGTTPLEVKLVPSAVELAVVMVRNYVLEGTAMGDVLTEQRSTGVDESISQELFGKVGAGDTADALKRVTGLTVVGGRFVYVRGMGERYSSTLLDGSSLPSPQPERRVVPLDLFPTDVIESITVRKTFSPELPGEFGGGTVVLKTRRMPEEFMMKAGVSFGYNAETTFKDGLTYDGGGTDFIGFDDGTRDLPGAIISSATQVDVAHYSPVDLERFGEAVPNRWSAREQTIDPDTGLNFTIGNKVDFFGADMGYLFGFIYDNKWRTRRGRLKEFVSVTSTGYESKLDYQYEKTIHTVNLGALLGLSWDVGGGSQLGLTSLVVRTSNDLAQIYGGTTNESSSLHRITETDWTEEMLWNNRVWGEHAIAGPVSFDWHFSLATASRAEPNRRVVPYSQQTPADPYLLNTTNITNEILYSQLDDLITEFGGSLKYGFGEKKEDPGFVAVGVSNVQRDREAETRRFYFHDNNTAGIDLSAPPESIFIPPNIGSGAGFDFTEITRPTDNYKASQTLFSTYLSTEIPFSDEWILAGGLRREFSDQEVTTFELFDKSNTPAKASLDDTDILPSFVLTWKFQKDMQVRAGYGRTLSRPDFRELSRSSYTRVLFGTEFAGNPDLERTLIDNYDVRWEWYLEGTQNVSVGLFYKQLDAPIESVFLTGANDLETLENAKSGTTLGLEVEFRKSLEFVGDLGKDLYLMGNFAWIDSEVEISGASAATDRKHPLQGQSPYVINLALGYDSPGQETSLTLLYNIFGERVVALGTEGLPNVEEQPVSQVDLVLGQKLNETWSVKFKIQNLLNQEVRFRQGGQTVETYEKGISVGLGLGASF